MDIQVIGVTIEDVQEKTSWGLIIVTGTAKIVRP